MDPDHDDVAGNEVEDLAAYDDEDEDEPQHIRFRDLKRAPRRVDSRPAPVLADTPDDGPDSAGFQTTYQPGRFERGWLLSSLKPFYTQNLITDILASVKGGKEASVYRCQGHPSTGTPFLAAKVYRPRQFHNLRNDKMYREGRAVLNADGNAVKKSDQRIMRALGKKSDFGRTVQHTSWLMYEYTTLETLYRAGASVPRPYAAGENAILMTYEGDENGSAPTLIEVELEKDEANRLFRETLRNIALMLQHGFVHGDLSAYNILYWEGRITLIDFPQVADTQANPHARFILERDITRVCDYFARQGADTGDPARLLKDLWAQYGPPDDSGNAALAAALTAQSE